MFHVNLKPNTRQLRQFGAIGMLALPTLGLLWTWNVATLMWSIPVGLVIGAFAQWAPQALLPFYIVLTVVTLPIGIVVGEVCLLSIYFGLFVPLGLVFRLIGRDALELHPAKDADTFWRPRSPRRHARSYFRQS